MKSELQPSVLKKMMAASYLLLKEKQDYLDSINVFPVPDGDTGINMLLTMKTIVDEMEKVPQNGRLEDYCSAISKGAFKGAKGNSGTILSQFLIGFVNELKAQTKIDQFTFANALTKGSKKAYSAVEHPKEGTMLTIFRAMSETATKIIQTNPSSDWKVFVQEIFNNAQKTTLETIDMMKELKEGGVVDSGALGVVYMFQGWAMVIEEESGFTDGLVVSKDLEGLHSQVDTSKVEADLVFRYCTEALVKGAKISENEARKIFSEFGDFLLIMQEADMIKIHVHTDRPVQTIQEAERFGAVDAIKIDDMLSQSQTNM